MKSVIEFSFAAAAAALFVNGCSKSGEQAPAATAAEASAASEGSADKVKCFGINECKGQSQCGVPGAHSCAGQNDCKGKGWIQVSAEECASQGGKVL